jgi:transposase InsO family protein
LQNNITQRLNRESCIPDEDIEQTVKQIIAHPFLGGHKGSLKLQCDETAYLGSTSYQEIKQQLKLAVAQELLQRKEQSELAKAQYQRYRDKEQPYEKIAPKKKHDVWAIDFLNLLLFGVYFRICVVYDLFSQAYLAIQPACYASYAVAQQALQQACDYSGQTPEKCLLSDHGKQFKCYSFEETKRQLNIKSQYIPRGQPWHNGALESGNRDLRTVLYTIAFYEACQDTRISKTGVASDQIYTHLQHYCRQALTVINEQLVRPKFKTTPLAVLQDQVAAKQQQRLRFIEKKRQQRKQRMAQLKRHGGSHKKRIEDKVAAAWRKVSSNMSSDQLFAFRELINKRYQAVAI